MSNCPSIEPFVTPYVDGELADADRQILEQHLGRCPPCRARLAAERAVRGLFCARRQGLQHAGAPASLRAKCADAGARAASGDRRSDASATSARWLGRLAPLAVAATLILIVGGAFLHRLTESSTRVLVAELTADHVKCFLLNAVLGTRQAPAVVESSLAANFDWRARLPERAELAGLELVGARPCLYGEGRVAHIMYRHNGRPVSLFMLPRKRRPEELVRVMGHEAAVWADGDRTFVLIAREPRSEVERMASFVHATLR